MRILVVDDEHTLRESCATVLQYEGHDVTSSGGGQEALELLRRRAFDVVLVDLSRPRISRRASAATFSDLSIDQTGNRYS